MALWRCLCGANNDGTEFCEACDRERPNERAHLPRPSAADPLDGLEELPVTPEEAREYLVKIRELLARVAAEPAEIPIGACPKHPGGCGRSGHLWPSGEGPRA
jgi:hypothetical protein